eukprot:PhM_4_TR1301/c1_g1_i1/m.105379/K00383/GSR, gor; glutathione reductase (NADPH)
MSCPLPLAQAAQKVYDLVVIGAGSGGLEAAWNIATTYKKSVAVVEPQINHGPPHYAALGGTCVNVGCVPKKLLVTAANYSHTFRDSVGFGWAEAASKKVDWEKLMKAKDDAVAGINKSYVGMFEDAKMDLLLGWGSMKDANTVLVCEEGPGKGTAVEIKAKNTLIAVGGWPTRPNVPGIEHTITSNEAFYIKQRPSSVLIVGGGYIAVEFACIFNGLGVESTTLMYRGELFLRGFDSDVRSELRNQMKEYPGMNLVFGDNIAKIELQPDGQKKVTTENGQTFVTDIVMYATGRHPRTDGLNLEGVGVALDAKSKAVLVDPQGRTNVSNIWALGDVTNRIQLTPVAIHEGDVVADSMFGEARSVDHNAVASAVFSIPPIGTVGLTDEAAAKKFPRVAVYKTRFKPLMHNITGFEYKGFLAKVVTDHSTGTVVGVHLLGSDAPEIIQGVAIAVKMGAKLKDFYSTIGVHPTSAEELCSMRTPDYFFVDGKKSETPGSSL